MQNQENFNLGGNRIKVIFSSPHVTVFFLKDEKKYRVSGFLIKTLVFSNVHYAIDRACKEESLIQFKARKRNEGLNLSGEEGC